ncbi:uncharacterized protein [Procambarus clarkii]|uniref:uncharacterized protein n=1 Tax=Procambarus clarkii TaxID=6728 RepID=UPI003744ACBF
MVLCSSDLPGKHIKMPIGTKASPSKKQGAASAFYVSCFERMSNITSPQRFSGTFDHFYDGPYEPDISTQMKVPKRIRVTGDNEDDPTVNWARYNGINEKFEMKVPDRIVVAGMMLVPERIILTGKMTVHLKNFADEDNILWLWELRSEVTVFTMTCQWSIENFIFTFFLFYVNLFLLCSLCPSLVRSQS